MKKKDKELNDELRPEYDFSQMQIVKRGSGRKQPQEIMENSEKSFTLSLPLTPNNLRFYLQKRFPEREMSASDQIISLTDELKAKNYEKISDVENLVNKRLNEALELEEQTGTFERFGFIRFLLKLESGEFYEEFEEMKRSHEIYHLS